MRERVNLAAILIGMRPCRNAVLLFLALLAAGAFSQDRFPAPIPPSGIGVAVEDVATLPDSSPGQPPRVSVLIREPGGRLFANDQRGPLYAIDESSGFVSKYLDLRDFAELALVSTNEAGFQSFAFHPDFHDESSPGFGRFYTIHSSGNTDAQPDFDPGGSTSFHTLLLEWRTSEPEANFFSAADEQTPYRELIRFKQPFGNHNAGLIAFNPLTVSQDSEYGDLYIAMGDGGSGGDPQENGQDTSNPYGALLRIDPLGSDGRNGNYGIVLENAFAADGDPNTIPEIYCYGLRNPQRFGWDSETGRCYIADIGQNAVEEINLAGNGLNFGWDNREGSFPFEGGDSSGLVNPISEYDHFNLVVDPPTVIPNRAVTVGEVVRSVCAPELSGKLPLGDFPTGLIFLLDVDGDPFDGGQDGLTELALLDENGQAVRFLELVNAARSRRGLASSSRADLRFGVNMSGGLYLTNKHDGVVRRVKGVATPTLALRPPQPGSSTLKVEFSGELQTSSELRDWGTEEISYSKRVASVPVEEKLFLRALCP